MKNNKYKADQLSFWQLIKKTKIQIPIIQRDYAQGRIEKKVLRKRFLNSIANALEGDSLELDFIYGSTSKDTLQPLDGQQRLTTLFLLYWYAASKEDCLDESIKSILEKFTYETRTSSRDFCINLVNKGISIKERQEAISDTIKDSPWFFEVWQKDPTIKAMLIMLDDIHSMFKNKGNMWKILTDESIRPITFHYIELEDLDLTDDLYIKMNARGKQLTPFENFKASTEKKIEDKNWDKGRDIKDCFPHKADTKWTDLFWKNRGSINEIDEAFIKFISNSIVSSTAARQIKSSKKKDKESLIQDLFNNPENTSQEDLEEDNYTYLYTSLETYSNQDPKTLCFPFPIWQLQLSKWDTLFDIITKEKSPTYPQRVLFYAQTEYLINSKPITKETFDNWMRVTRNIVQNSTIDSSESFVGAINLIKEISVGSRDIYTFLSTNKIKSGFASVQVQEEILKANLIQADSGNVKAIFGTEDTNFCKGRISFALYCIDFDSTTTNSVAKKLSKIKKVFNTYIDDDDISNDLRSGLLTIGDTNFYNYWWSWLHAVKATKRRLILDTNDLRSFAYNQEYGDYLKKLLNKLTRKGLTDLLSDYKPAATMPNWKYRLIKKPSLLNYSEKHYIAIKEDESCCYLLPRSRVANSKEGRKKCKRIK